MKSASPLEAFLSWYQNLPISNKEDIAFLIMASTPIFGGIRPNTLELDQLVKEFESRVESYVHDVYTNVGVSLILRQNVEFFLMSKRRTPGEWKKFASDMRQQAKLEKDEERANRLRALAEKFEERQPFSEKQWLRSVTQWDLLLGDRLSTSYLEEWFNHSLFSWAGEV